MCKLVKKIDVASIQNRNLNVNLFQCFGFNLGRTKMSIFDENKI